MPHPTILVHMHAGYLAGRYRDGSWSDDWTDVGRCAEATFTAYRAACSCGWAGRVAPADASGREAARSALAAHATAAAVADRVTDRVAAPRAWRRGRALPRPVRRLAPL